MIKFRYLMAGLIFWAAAGGGRAATDRPGAVAEMQAGLAELGALLESKGVVFQPATLAADALLAAARAIDPGAAIVTPEQARGFQEEEKGVFYDVGLKLAQLDADDDQRRDAKAARFKIMDVATNGPAQVAGVRPGLLLEKIDGQSTAGMTYAQVVNRLRGRKNEPASLTVRAEDKDAKAQVFKVNRSIVQPPVTGTMELWPQQIGYLKVNGLFEDSGEEIAAQLQIWAATNCVGILLDLRGANGVNLDAVAQVAGLFTHSTPTLLTVKDGFGKALKTYPAAQTNPPIAKPMMALVDRNTRGAAETLAAVLQDCNGVMLIGTPTRGDDRLREPLGISGDRVLYIAVKRIDLGKESYNGKGVRPDVSVAPAAEDGGRKEPVEEDLGLFSGLSDHEKQERALNTRIGNDTILRQATDILLGLKALNLYKL